MSNREQDNLQLLGHKADIPETYAPQVLPPTMQP